MDTRNPPVITLHAFTQWDSGWKCPTSLQARSALSSEKLLQPPSPPSSARMRSSYIMLAIALCLAAAVANASHDGPQRKLAQLPDLGNIPGISSIAGGSGGGSDLINTVTSLAGNLGGSGGSGGDLISNLGNIAGGSGGLGDLANLGGSGGLGNLANLAGGRKMLATE
ncbi:hypothetical protein COCOBI_02-8000 [Coccomyxa sp. Obi]|nr:hypothetical protein COCOBI_02-8000 [Coccomyxa sp. Obi]